MSYSDFYQLAIAYAPSINSIIDMLCTTATVYAAIRLRNASQRG